MSGYLIEKKIILKDVEEISISEEKVLVRGTDEIIKEVDKSSFGGGSAISVTKSELDDLISNNSLIPGAYYKVSGVHPTLYDDGTSSGTTIFIKAVTTNMLEKNGHGLFYNPKYDQEVDGFGIWSNNKSNISLKLENNPKTNGRNPFRNERFVVKSTGEVVCANLAANNLQKMIWNSDGTVTSSILATIFFIVGPIIIDVDDMIYIAAGGGTQLPSYFILRVDSAGLAYTHAVLSVPVLDIIVDSNKIVYAKIQSGSDFSLAKIETGQPINEAYVTVPDIREMAVNSEGVVFFTTSDSIYRISNEGSINLHYTNSQPFINYTIKVGQNDELIFVKPGTSNIMCVLEVGSSTPIEYSDTGSLGIHDFDMTSDGTLYVSVDGYFTNSIKKIKLGETVNDFGHGLANMQRVIIYNNQFVYVADPVNGAMSQYDTSINFDFQVKEIITSDNGATATLDEDLGMGIFYFTPISGDWYAASKVITSNITESSAKISTVNLFEKNIGDKAIWGGYSWTNNSGSPGEYYDQFTLSSDWDKDIYDLDNYNPSLDIIEYDYPNDWISRRYEIESGNDVKCSFIQHQNLGFENSSIKVFQFGNQLDVQSTYRGLLDIRVDDAYFENINFIGSIQKSLHFKPTSQQYDCTYALRCEQESMNFEYGACQRNVTFNKDTRQYFIDLNRNAQLSDLVLPTGFSMGNLNLSSAAYISGANFLEGANMSNIHFETPMYLNADLSTATLLYDNYPKTVYNRPDGTTKIRYYDNDDNLVISDITD